MLGSVITTTSAVAAQCGRGYLGVWFVEGSNLVVGSWVKPLLDQIMSADWIDTWHLSLGISHVIFL